MKRFFSPPVLLVLALSLALAGCGGNPPPVTYKPLDYSYLPPILLKVAALNVQNNYVPDAADADLLAQAPEAPAQALTDMANQRLVPNGTPGMAVFTIETASISQNNNILDGEMAVRLDVATPDNRSTGYTEASVSYTEPAPSSGSQADMQAALYDVTKQLMNAMNVQLQYQIQNNLGTWVAYSSSAASAPVTTGGSGASGAIQATPLPGPGATPVQPSQPGQTLTPPEGSLGTLPATGTPQALIPPPTPMAPSQPTSTPPSAANTPATASPQAVTPSGLPAVLPGMIPPP